MTSFNDTTATLKVVITHCAQCGRVMTSKDKTKAPCPRCGRRDKTTRNYSPEQPMTDALAAAGNWDPSRGSDGIYDS